MNTIELEEWIKAVKKKENPEFIDEKSVTGFTAAYKLAQWIEFKQWEGEEVKSYVKLTHEALRDAADLNQLSKDILRQLNEDGEYEIKSGGAQGYKIVNH